MIDLKECEFYHIRVAEESTKYMSFVTELGQFEYTRMPFGLKTAPSKFQRFVNQVLKEQFEKADVVDYMDDFLIATVTIEHQTQVLSEVFSAMVNNKLQIRIDKCKFLCTEIEGLGYLVSEKDIQPSKRY